MRSRVLSLFTALTFGGGAAVGCGLEGAGFQFIEEASTADGGPLDGALSPSGAFTVGGEVSGLRGSGLVLQLNERDPISVASDGPFTFAQEVNEGTSFSVTVREQPTSPAQTCGVTRGVGTMPGADVTNVSVVCALNYYTVGGAVVGLAAGSEIVLENNAGDAIVVAGDGAFVFPVPIGSGAGFEVAVASGPTAANQTCTVSGGVGTVVGGNVTSVLVNCTTNTYTVGGEVSGLDGVGLVLENGVGNELPIDANGGFSFPPQEDGATYAVSVKSQPTSKPQTCTVTSGSGTLAGANVTSVAVTCVTNAYPVGGTIVGLSVGGLVLANHGGDAIELEGGDEAFTFPTPVAAGTAYDVTVKAHPAGLRCSVEGGEGTVTSGPVASIAVTCVPHEGDGGVDDGGANDDGGDGEPRRRSAAR